VRFAGVRAAVLAVAFLRRFADFRAAFLLLAPDFLLVLDFPVAGFFLVFFLAGIVAVYHPREI
jgi:hypothetical protein